MNKFSKKYWNTQEEIDLLVYLFNTKGLTIGEIAKEMKRSVATIKRKIYELKLTRKNEIKRKILYNARKGEKNGMYGKSSWCKGLTKQNNKIINTRSGKQSQKMKELYDNNIIEKPTGIKNGMYGKKSWNSGYTKENNVILKNIGIKSSKTKREKWENSSKEEKEKRFNQLKEARKAARRKQTIPETIIEKWLIDNCVKFEKQKSMSYFLIDFYINDKIVIECMGDYWHANPNFYKTELTLTQIKNKERDTRKMKYLKTNNIPYLFLWEHDIKDNFLYVEKQLLDFINKKS